MISCYLWPQNRSLRLNSCVRSSHSDQYVISTVPILVYNSDLNSKPWDKPANDHRPICSFPLRGSPFRFLRHGLLCYLTLTYPPKSTYLIISETAWSQHLLNRGSSTFLASLKDRSKLSVASESTTETYSLSLINPLVTYIGVSSVARWVVRLRPSDPGVVALQHPATNLDVKGEHSSNRPLATY